MTSVKMRQTSFQKRQFRTDHRAKCLKNLLLLSRLKKKSKEVKKCDHLLKKDERQTDGKWKLLLPRAAQGADSIQSICRLAALCHEQQVRAPHCHAQWEFSACRVKVTRTCLLMRRMHNLFMILKSWVEVKMQLCLDFLSVWIRAP